MINNVNKFKLIFMPNVSANLPQAKIEEHE